MSGESGLEGESGLVYSQRLVDVIGPLYRVDDGLRERGMLDSCRQYWKDNKIPFFFGGQGMGKSHILKPYLEKTLEAVVLEPKDLRLYRLQTMPERVIFLARVHGSSETNKETECAHLIHSICVDSGGLFNSSKFQAGRLGLVVNGDDVDRMAMSLVDDKKDKLGIRYKLGRKKVVEAFRQFNFPVMDGVAHLKNLLYI